MIWVIISAITYLLGFGATMSICENEHVSLDDVDFWFCMFWPLIAPIYLGYKLFIKNKYPK